MSYARITGTGSYLPEKILTNKDLENIVDTNDEWIRDRTGIRQRHIAGENAIPPYLIFSDAALRDMARQRPTTPENFLQVHGVGQKKAADYGKRFTSRIKRYCRENQIDVDISVACLENSTNNKI